MEMTQEQIELTINEENKDKPDDIPKYINQDESNRCLTALAVELNENTLWTHVLNSALHSNLVLAASRWCLAQCAMGPELSS
jgi:hypothetical protein